MKGEISASAVAHFEFEIDSITDAIKANDLVIRGCMAVLRTREPDGWLAGLRLRF